MSSALAILLSILSLLLLSLGTLYIAKRTKLPYTVLLVLVGLLLIPISKLSMFSFLAEFKLTPDLLFFLILPTLIFESAYNMNVRKFMENIRSISLLSIASLLISAIVVALGIFYGTKLFGFAVPFEIALLFGTLISATDPVAVLALFKEYGAPKRLSLIFEGESLFNDGTSLALFLVVLDILLAGWNGVSSVLEGVFMFTTMVLGGVLFGALMGALFSKIIEQVKDNEYVEITLTMIVAHFTFIFSELISHWLHLFGHEIKLSSIIATVVAAMMVGNYGRYKISPRVEEFMEKFWGYVAFVANSIVFILIGLLFAELPVKLSTLAAPVLVTIIVVMIARAISVYPVIGVLNFTKKESFIPRSWQHLLAWGSLRGALAVTMVLLIPDDFTVQGWSLSGVTPKEFITALTIACIYFTLFIKATTIGPMIKKLGVSDLSMVEELEYQEGRALIYAKVLFELERFLKKGYINNETYRRLKEKYNVLYKEACARCSSSQSEDNSIPMRMLTIYATGIERSYLRTLFLYKEINESIYKKILTELTIRLERATQGDERVDIAMTDFKKDWLDSFNDLCARVFIGVVRSIPVSEQLFMYYRARAIIARKVIDELTKLLENNQEIFANKQVSRHIISQYEDVERWAISHTVSLRETHPDAIEPLALRFAEAGIYKAEEHILEDLYERDSVSTKVYLLLHEELSLRTERVMGT